MLVAAFCNQTFKASGQTVPQIVTIEPIVVGPKVFYHYHYDVFGKEIEWSADGIIRRIRFGEPTQFVNDEIGTNFDYMLVDGVDVVPKVIMDSHTEVLHYTKNVNNSIVYVYELHVEWSDSFCMTIATGNASSFHCEPQHNAGIYQRTFEFYYPAEITVIADDTEIKILEIETEYNFITLFEQIFLPFVKG